MNTKIGLCNLFKRKKVIYDSQLDRGQISAKQHAYNLKSIKLILTRINTIDIQLYNEEGGDNGYYDSKEPIIFINKAQHYNTSSGKYDYTKLAGTIFHELIHSSHVDFHYSPEMGISSNMTTVMNFFSNITYKDIEFEGGRYSSMEIIATGYSMINYIKKAYGRDIHEVNEKLMQSIIIHEDCLINPDLYRIIGFFRKYNKTDNLLSFLKNLL